MVIATAGGVSHGPVISRQRLALELRCRRVGPATTARCASFIDMAYVSKYRDPHPSCPQPDDGTVKVWRYSELPQLVNVLARRALPFIRVDLFADKFEGSVTRPVQAEWGVNPINAATLARVRPELKREMYASCWHAGEDESEAMWKLYCGDRGGVAMQTTYERLDASLPREVRLAKVTELRQVQYGRGGEHPDAVYA
jgi:hypothetical protein